MSRKSDLYALVAELWQRHLPRIRIAELLALSPQRVGQVIADLELEADLDLPSDLLARCAHFRFENESQAKTLRIA